MSMITGGRARRAGAAVLPAAVLLTVALPAAGPAAAQQPDPPAALALVLDASGSMAGTDPSGATKMEAARRALGGVVDRLPTGTQVAVRAYGGTYDDRQRGCTDTRLLLPAGAVDVEATKAALASLRPVGYTPIAAALEAASADLPADGPRSIVLVSDGEETCGEDPCEVARRLGQQAVGLRVDTVGYGVDDSTRRQLSCIAAATSGTYTEAPDGDSLTVELARLAAPGLRQYAPSGKRVSGTADPLGAPVLTAGQYVDSLAVAQRTYYAVDLAQGVTPYLSATLVRPPGKVPSGTYDNLVVELLGPDGTKCGDSSQGVSQSNGGTAATTVAVPGMVGSKWSGSYSSASAFGGSGTCGLPGRYTVSVERDENSRGQGPLPVELRFLLEPPVANPADLPPAVAPVPPALPAPMLSTPLTPVSGGGSFSTAAELAPGSWVDEIRPGETLYYRVPVGWGQRFTFLAQVPPAQADLARSLPTAPLTALVAGPARTTLDLQPGAEESAYYSARYDADGASLSGSTPPVVFRNREVSDSQLRPYSLAGDHYLVVQLGAVDSNADAAVPLRLAVEVTGGVQGEPSYGKATGAIPEQPTGSGATSEGTASGNPSPAADTPSDESPASGSASADVQDARDRDTDSGPWRAVGYAGGGMLALIVAVLLLLTPMLRGRRSARR